MHGDIKMEKEVVSNATQDSVSDQPEKKEFVKFDTHNKLLGQHKKVQEQLASMQEQLSMFQQAETQREEKELAKQGEYKKLIELREGKIQELTESLNLERESAKSSKEREATTWKLQSFYGKLPGKIKDSAYLQHVDLDSIVYDSESMACDEQSVEKVVNDFMEKHPHLVEPLNKAKLPNQAPVPSFDISNKSIQKVDAKTALNSALAKAFGA